ncbi:hypothetical protein VHARVF571_220021 [Vibrio harveyi]|nr:hypothetical protein VHARVF571_220021 [Vibrio harveyi]
MVSVFGVVSSLRSSMMLSPFIRFPELGRAGNVPKKKTFNYSILNIIKTMFHIENLIFLNMRIKKVNCFQGL